MVILICLVTCEAIWVMLHFITERKYHIITSLNHLTGQDWVLSVLYRNCNQGRFLCNLTRWQNGCALTYNCCNLCFFECQIFVLNYTYWLWTSFYSFHWFYSKWNLHTMTAFLLGSNVNLILLVDFSLPANVNLTDMWGAYSVSYN